MDELLQEDSNCVDFLPEKLVSKICVSILGEALEQLLILKTINNWPDADQLDVTYKTVEERFSKSPQRTTQSEIDISLDFKRRYAYVLAIVKTAFEEFQQSGSYHQLVHIINVFKMMKSDEGKLKEDALKKAEELKSLECVFEEDAQFYHRKIDECVADIGRIKDEIEDFKIESEIKLNYVKNWQASKMEMTETLLAKNEQQKMDDIKKLESNEYREIRVHKEILAAYYEMQKELESQIEIWKTKYENHLKELDTIIKNLQEERENQLKATAKLQELYTKRQKDIDSYKAYKAKQQEIKSDLEKRNKAANKIQAWWRGTMVRKGFGKFRKKKDKKPKKKSSEHKAKA